VLIATDIAARGIDVPGVSLVVNYELPNVPEVYVHRIGRTARAGAEGTAVTFCAPDERSLLRDIEKMLKVAIPVEKAPEGTYVDALADPDGDFAPLNRTQRPRQGARPQGAKPQGQGRKPGRVANLVAMARAASPVEMQGRKPAEAQAEGKTCRQPASACCGNSNRNGEQPAAAKPRRRPPQR
jgi:ATP-dependent RNA helicase RhlE